MNLLANSLTSFACGIQVESFRKIRGNGMATTMCIGNLRSGTQNFYCYFQSRDTNDLVSSALYFGIILCCSVLLFLAFAMMFIDYEHDSRHQV